MAQLLNPHKKLYREAFDFLASDLPKLQATLPDLWLAFEQCSNLKGDEAMQAVSMNGLPPLIFASDLGYATFGQFETANPGRIKIGTAALQWYMDHPGSADAREFLRAKVLHEICHWGCYQKNVPDNDSAGEVFETKVYGGELPAPWVDQPLAPLANDDSIFESAEGRAETLTTLLGKSGFAPGRLDDPRHAVFGGKDVAEAMPRGFRNNNPGNIRVGTSDWRGLADPVDQMPFQAWEKNFCVFREPEWGLRALAYLLKSYKHKYHLDTPRKIISRWAPAADNNDVDSYAQKIAYALGITQDSTVDVDDETSLKTMMRAIARHENGEWPPYSDVQYETAIALLG